MTLGEEGVLVHDVYNYNCIVSRLYLNLVTTVLSAT